MINKKVFYIIFFAFILMQPIIVSVFFIKPKDTISLGCISSFIRNSDSQKNITYIGEITLSLHESGEGSLSIHGYSNESVSRKFHWAYFFKYSIDNGEVLNINLISEKPGIDNELARDSFRKDFFGLNFKLRGGLRIHKFSNIYILSVPGVIVNTCAPIKFPMES